MSTPRLNPYQQGVVDRLRRSADIFEARASVYKDNYRAVGRVVEALFPDGHTQSDQSDHNRWHLFELVIVKLTRYANNYDAGGHEDSIDDMIVYLSMLGQLDAELRADQPEREADEIAPDHDWNDEPEKGTPEYWGADWWGDPFKVGDFVILRHHWGKGETFVVKEWVDEEWVVVEDIAGNKFPARQDWLRPMDEEPSTA